MINHKRLAEIAVRAEADDANLATAPKMEVTLTQRKVRGQKRVPVLINGIVYPSMSAAAEFHGLTITAIFHAVNRGYVPVVKRLNARRLTHKEYETMSNSAASLPQLVGDGGQEGA